MTTRFLRGTLTPLALLLAIMMLAACASGPRTASTGERFDDTVITAKVKTEILRDADLSVREISVETFKGRVQLSGFVSSQGEIDRAVAIARNVNGVTSVSNDIRLK